MRAKRKLDHGLSHFSKHRGGLRNKFKKCHIEDQFLRFPHLSESIFNQLDDVTLADCRKVNRIWLNFIDNERFLWIRVIKKKISSLLNVPGPLSRKQTRVSKFQERWKNVFNKTPLMIIKDLAFSVKNFRQEVYGGETPLHFIAFKGNIDSYKFFCQYKADKNPKCYERITPLHYAAEAGNTEIVKYILENVFDKLPKSKSGGWTPLHTAAHYGQFKSFEIIADKVEDKNLVDNIGAKLLSNAVFFGHLNICKYIVANVQNMNLKNELLHSAAEYGRYEIYKEIAESEVDKNPTNDYGETPLSVAIDVGHLDICKYILANAQNKKLLKKKGCSFLHRAAQLGHYEIYKEIAEHVEDINPAGLDGWTSLHLAVDRGHFEVCKYIVKNIWQKNPPIKSGTGMMPGHSRTPLHIAAEHGHLRIYKLIAKYLKDMNPPDYRRVTPLHIAVRGKHFNVCEYIIQNVKDRHPGDIWSQTPLQLAIKHDYYQVVQLYEEMDKKDSKNISDKL